MTEDKTLKEEAIFSRIKEYAEEHTALFTAICSGLVAFFAICLKLCYFSYQYGKLAAFHIDMNTVDLIKDTTIFNVLFYIVLAGILIIVNYLGYLSYRHNALIKYFLGLFLLFLVLCSILFSNLLEASLFDIVKNINYVFLIVFFSIIFVPIINMIVIINTISPSINDLNCRLETKYNKTNKKYNKDKQKHIKKYTIQLNKLLLKKEKIEAKNNKVKNRDKLIKRFFSLLKLRVTSYKNTKEFNLKTIQKNIEQIDDYIKKYKLEFENMSKDKSLYKNTEWFFKIIITAIILVVIVIMLFIVGYNQTKDITSIDIIENTSYFIKENNTTDCAIIYQNDKYIIVSPCYEEDNKLKINTSYQYRTENSNITKHNVTYNTITITQYGDLTEYYKK